MAEVIRRHVAHGATWGRIINISTDAASCHPWNVSYAACKHAIESYSRSAACEVGKYGITVNIVAPGPVQTGYITPEMERGIDRETPMGRVGRPEDIADAVTLLASASPPLAAPPQLGVACRGPAASGAGEGAREQAGPTGSGGCGEIRPVPACRGQATEDKPSPAPPRESPEAARNQKAAECAGGGAGTGGTAGQCG